MVLHFLIFTWFPRWFLPGSHSGFYLVPTMISTWFPQWFLPSFTLVLPGSHSGFCSASCLLILSGFSVISCRLYPSLIVYSPACKKSLIRCVESVAQEIELRVLLLKFSKCNNFMKGIKTCGVAHFRKFCYFIFISELNKNEKKVCKEYNVSQSENVN